MSQEDSIMIAEASLNTIWRYNGAEFALDVGDADDAEHFEECMQRMSEAEHTIKKDGKASEFIRAYDKLFRDTYDDLFGDGAGDTILGVKRNVDNCNESWESFLAFIAAQGTAFQRKNEMLVSKYGGNRAQRRYVGRTR